VDKLFEYVRGINGRKVYFCRDLREGIVRPLGALPLHQRSDIAISIFLEEDENSEKVFANDVIYRILGNNIGCTVACNQEDI